MDELVFFPVPSPAPRSADSISEIFHRRTVVKDSSSECFPFTTGLDSSEPSSSRIPPTHYIPTSNPSSPEQSSPAKRFPFIHVHSEDNHTTFSGMVRCNYGVESTASHRSIELPYCPSTTCCPRCECSHLHRREIRRSLSDKESRMIAAYSLPCDTISNLSCRVKLYSFPLFLLNVCVDGQLSQCFWRRNIGRLSRIEGSGTVQVNADENGSMTW